MINNISIFNNLEIRLFQGEDGRQSFCWVDKEGSIKGWFGMEFLKSMLEASGVTLDEFLESKGWRLDE